jgi:hypothetical protein
MAITFLSFKKVKKGLIKYSEHMINIIDIMRFGIERWLEKAQSFH